MDYVDWCLQAYITTITPITYSQGFHQVVSTVLYTLLTFESLEALNVFVQSTIVYNSLALLQTIYWQVCIVWLNGGLSSLYNVFNGISVLSFIATIIQQTWTVQYYIIRSTFASYTSLSIDAYPYKTFPCVCADAACETCEA